MQPLTRPLTFFLAYDIRGRLDEDLTAANAYRVGRAYAEVLKAGTVVLGHDARPSSPGLARAVARGLVAAGVEVLDLGLSGSEEMYFAVSHLRADGGICVTASHNPLEYNGMKMVQAGSAPLGADTHMAAIKALAESGDYSPDRPGGRVLDATATRAQYVDCVLGFVPAPAPRPLKLVVNAGNGAAGPTFDAIADALARRGVPWEFHRMHHDPDGSFPNGIPNPLLPGNQPPTARAVRRAGADLAIAWDGDFDRCFFFDHEGSFVPGEYIVGLLAEIFLTRSPGATIVHDPRVIWNTQHVVKRLAGKSHISQCGHTNIKRALRDRNAIYGGEMSAHHYFRDFYFCDSGMIPWMMICALLGQSGRSLKDLVAESRAAFPTSGEVNFRPRDPAAAIARVDAIYGPTAADRDLTDGLSLGFRDWRLNLRASRTEPLLRLNVEARGDRQMVDSAVTALRRIIDG